MTGFLLGFSIVAVVLVAAVFLVLVIRRWRSEEMDRDAKRERDRKSEEDRFKRELKDKVAAGTHTEEGHVRCAIAGCKHAATEPSLHIARDERSLGAWLKQRLGAPPRLRIVRGAKSRYCRPHEALIAARFRHRLAGHEEKRAAFLAAEDADLADFEHDIDAAVSSEQASKRDAVTLASIPPPPAIPAIPVIPQLATSATATPRNA